MKIQCVTNTFCWLACGKIRAQAQGCDLFWANGCAQARISCRNQRLIRRLQIFWDEQKACAQARIFVNWAKSLCSDSDFFWLSKRLILRLGGEIQACPSVLPRLVLDVLEFLRFGWFFPFFRKIRFWSVLGPPSYGIGATIRIGWEMLCLPYAGFLRLYRHQ